MKLNVGSLFQKAPHTPRKLLNRCLKVFEKVWENFFQKVFPQKIKKERMQNV
jgi:hypothetical protein